MPNGLLSGRQPPRPSDGLALSLTLPWYRSLWLSSVGTLRVTIDGDAGRSDDPTFELAGERYALDELPRAERGALVPAGAPAADRRASIPSPSARPTRSRSSASCACRTCRSPPGRTAAPGCTSEHRAPDADAHGDRSGCRGPCARHRRGPAAARHPKTTPSSSASLSTPPASEFRAGWYDFDSLLARVAELGIGPGIEIVASQVLPTYPARSRTSSYSSWRAGFDKYGFDDSFSSAPTSTWADVAIAT